MTEIHQDEWVRGGKPSPQDQKWLDDEFQRLVLAGEVQIYPRIVVKDSNDLKVTLDAPVSPKSTPNTATSAPQQRKRIKVADAPKPLPLKTVIPM